MEKYCDGKNAYKPITKTRYYMGLAIFCLLHLNFKLTIFLRHRFIKKYPNYKTLKDFHNTYFSQMLKEIIEKKGMRIGNARKTHEN
jgi:hypothetical protein